MRKALAWTWLILAAVTWTAVCWYDFVARAATFILLGIAAFGIFLAVTHHALEIVLKPDRT